MRRSIISSLFIALTMIFAVANFNIVSAQQTVEDQYWEMVKNSTKTEDFQNYLKEYPDGKYAAIARGKLGQNKAKPSSNSFLSFADSTPNLANMDFMKRWANEIKPKMPINFGDTEIYDANPPTSVEDFFYVKVWTPKLSPPVNTHAQADSLKIKLFSEYCQSEAFRRKITVSFTVFDNNKENRQGNSLSPRDCSANTVPSPTKNPGSGLNNTSANDPSYLITANSVGNLRLGMTVAEARKALIGLNVSPTEGMDGVPAFEVKQGAIELMLFYTCEDDQGNQNNENSKIESIQILDSRFRTAEGVHPKMKINDAVKIYGKVKIYDNEIGGESAEFSSERYMTFSVEGGIFNPGENENGRPVTTRYAPNAAIDQIWISKEVCEKVLLDFRKSEDNPETNLAIKEVFTYIFGNKADPDLTITSNYSGSFTKPYTNEVLYYIGGCENDGVFTQKCGHANMWSAGRIAIFDGANSSIRIMKTTGNLGYGISRVTDINSDGVDEILSRSGFSNGGYTTAGATLGQITNGKYQEIESFYKGYSDGCGSLNKENEIKLASVISFIPTNNGRVPNFTEEYFQSGCQDSNWKKISKKEFDGKFMN